MIHLLVVILDDITHLPDLLAAWDRIGVPGVTILESAGAHRLGTWLSQVGLSALDRLFDSGEVRRRTLMAAIGDEDLLERAIVEAERVVGDFERPNTGVWLALPVARAGGLHKACPHCDEESFPSTVRPEQVARRETLIGSLPDVGRLKPVCVPPGMPMDAVAQAMLAQPDVHVVCVMAEDGRLMGLLDLHTVVDNIMLHVLPEEFLSKIADLEDVEEFADINRMRVAADAMQAPVSVRLDETVKDAFKRMHEHRLSGLPVLDASGHVTGYIGLMDLLSVFWGSPTVAAGPEKEPSA